MAATSQQELQVNQSRLKFIKLRTAESDQWIQFYSVYQRMRTTVGVVKQVSVANVNACALSPS